MTKGGKPTKPQSKKLAHLLASLERKTGRRDLAKRFLIVCEDGKSAPAYFRALRKGRNLTATAIEVVGANGHTQPVQVVQRAADLKREAARRDSGTLPFGDVWCVIDGDYGQKINAARAKAKAHGGKLAISTPCFEYWIWLHFEQTAPSFADCAAVIRSLRKQYLHDYDKGKCDFDAIVVHVRNASARARKLRAPRLRTDPLPENHSPCSELYKLVESILAS